MLSPTLPARPYSLRSLCASILAHGAGVLLLFCLPFMRPVSERHVEARTRWVPLVAPSTRPPSPRTARKITAAPRRVLVLPKPSATPRLPRQELPAAPVMHASIPTPELSAPLPRLTPPPPAVKTDAFAEPRVSPPAPRVSTRTSVAGFSSAETSAMGPHTGRLLPAGGFDTEGKVSTFAARRSPTAGGFVDAATDGEPRAVSGSVAAAGFGDVAVAAPLSGRPKAAAAVSSTPLEILFKPRPAYSDEARRRQIEGEVLLEVLFGATREIHILKVVRGLGHGLDQNAVRAAQAIRFRPARREGQPVDFVATVHIVFQLAY